MILLDCIALVESSNNSGALRFEQELFESDPSWVQGQVSKIMGANKCSEATALMIASTSWGKFQMLGANLYSFAQGDVPLQSIFSNDALQQELFGLFIKPRGYDPNEAIDDWEGERFGAFAKFYNGPGAIGNYVAAMKGTLVK
jgi:hypothetical protein